jgi:hypothetical protein
VSRVVGRARGHERRVSGRQDRPGGGSGVGRGVARSAGERFAGRAATKATGDGVRGEGVGAGVGTGVGATSGEGRVAWAEETPPALTRWTTSAASAACATAMRRIGALSGNAPGGTGRVTSSETPPPPTRTRTGTPPGARASEAASRARSISSAVA